MTNREKIYQHKEIISKLYEKEGKSKSYIANLLDVPRKLLIGIMNNEWEMQQAQKYHFSPKNQKLYNRYNKDILALLERGYLKKDISQILGLNYKTLRTLTDGDETLKKAWLKSSKMKEDERKKIQEENKQRKKEQLLLEYDPEDLEGEIWKPLPDNNDYMVSNMGRVKSYKKSLDSWALLKPYYGCKNNRQYLIYPNKRTGKRSGGQVARIVGFLFLKDEWSKEKNTINHKDGNVQNNKVENLEWLSQTNNKHSYEKRGIKKIIYKGKYEFKTISALARFIGQSETTIRRRIANPEETEIVVIYKNK